MKVISTTQGVFLFSSTIIGAGILALPVVASRAGFAPLAVMIVLMACVSTLSGLYIAEAALANPEPLQLPELAKKYLGNWGFAAMLVATIGYIYGALISYLSAGGQIFFVLSKGALPLWLGTLCYFALGSLILHGGIMLVSRVNSALMVVMLVLMGCLIGISVPSMQVPLLLRTEWTSARELFGVVLFAYLGHSVLPSIAFNLKEKRSIVRVVALGIALPCLLYLVWSFVVMGVVPAFSEDGHSLSAAQAAGQPATIPLGYVIGGSVILLGSVFAALSTLTSYIGFGVSLRDCYEAIARQKQLRLPPFALTGLVVLPPLLLAILFPGAFVTVLDLAGMFGGGMFVGILPVLIVLKLRRDPSHRTFTTWGGKWLAFLVMAVYLWGMGRTLLKLAGN